MASHVSLSDSDISKRLRLKQKKEIEERIKETRITGSRVIAGASWCTVRERERGLEREASYLAGSRTKLFIWSR